MTPTEQEPLQQDELAHPKEPEASQVGEHQDPCSSPNLIGHCDQRCRRDQSDQAVSPEWDNLAPEGAVALMDRETRSTGVGVGSLVRSRRRVHRKLPPDVGADVGLRRQVRSDRVADSG